MSGSVADGQLAGLQQQPFHVTEELLPALLGKLVKLVQENDIKTDADMDKTIDKAAGEVLEEATSKAKAGSEANVETGDEEAVQSKRKDVMGAEEDKRFKEDAMKKENDERDSKQESLNVKEKLGNKGKEQESKEAETKENASTTNTRNT